jgi:hypothetical protein
MTRTLGIVAVAAAAMSWLVAIPASREAFGAKRVTQVGPLSLEFVGQFQNSPAGVTPATHSHYGYLSYVGGLQAFSGSAESESSALFTFYADAATLRVIVDGPLRIITRTGKLTIYRDGSPDGSFDSPDSFRDGTRVLVGDFRQQVVNNTITGSFTTFHRVKITSTRPFPAGRRTVQLGRKGQIFRIALSGQGNMPGPPSGYFGGYGVSG